MKVLSNTAMSADGKIGAAIPTRWGLGSAEDLRRMSLLRAQADAVIIGGRTFRHWPIPHVEQAKHLSTPSARRRPILNIVLTRRGILEASPGRWPDPRARLLVLGPEGLDKAAHASCFGAEVHTTASPDLGWTLRLLAERGCERVLLEGGGDLLFQAMEADLLDELYLTICPLLVGGATAPTPADGRGFSPEEARRLELIEVERVDQELFLHYRVLGRAA